MTQNPCVTVVLEVRESDDSICKSHRIRKSRCPYFQFGKKLWEALQIPKARPTPNNILANKPLRVSKANLYFPNRTHEKGSALSTLVTFQFKLEIDAAGWSESLYSAYPCLHIHDYNSLSRERNVFSKKCNQFHELRLPRNAFNKTDHLERVLGGWRRIFKQSTSTDSYYFPHVQNTGYGQLTVPTSRHFGSPTQQAS